MFGGLRQFLVVHCIIFSDPLRFGHSKIETRPDSFYVKKYVLFCFISSLKLVDTAVGFWFIFHIRCLFSFQK